MTLAPAASTSVKRRVILESPYAAPDRAGLAKNARYLRACLRHSLLLGEAPFASHAIYTLPGVLDDTNAEERSMGMEAGWAWMASVNTQAVVAYTDLGWSVGMSQGVERAIKEGLKVEERQLGKIWQAIEDAHQVVAWAVPSWHIDPPTATANASDTNAELLTAIMADVVSERFRQERLCAEGKFTWTCADPSPAPAEKLAVLAEEFGEVAKEVTDTIIELAKYAKENLTHPPHRKAQRAAALYEELIQVAAVATAWAESLRDSKRRTP